MSGILERPADEDLSVPLARNTHKRQKVNERVGLDNDIVQLHARYISRLQEEKDAVPLRRENQRARVEAWQARKAGCEDDYARLRSWVGQEGKLVESSALRQACYATFDELKLARKQLLEDNAQLEKDASGDRMNEYALEAVAYLNNHHALVSDKLRLERRLPELRAAEEAPGQMVAGGESAASAPTDQLTLQEARAKLVALRANIRTNTHAYTQRFFAELMRGEAIAQERAQLADPSQRYHCDDCGGDLVEDDSTVIVCRNCGVVASTGYSFDPSVNMNFEELCAMPGRQDTYQRLNHFREYLRQIQGHSRAVLPNDLFEQLHDEFRKARVQPAHITPERVRAKLKKIRRSKFYEHCESIAERMNPDYNPVQLDPAHEEKLCLMFVQLEEPFERIKHLVKRDRKNFVSYPYVFFKLNELNGWDHYNRNCALLKSVALLNVQDAYWKRIMRQLGWEVVGRTFDVHRKGN